MGNCAAKPKVITDAEAPAPEQPKEPLLEDQKIKAEKSLSHLFLEDKANEKPMSDAVKDKTAAPETGDHETASARESSAETERVIDDLNPKNEETVDEEKVVLVMSVRETETEEKEKKKDIDL